nr:hypothetical protein GCM10020093_042890 [Planobispora longispora]
MDAVSEGAHLVQETGGAAAELDQEPQAEGPGQDGQVLHDHRIGECAAMPMIPGWFTSRIAVMSRSRSPPSQRSSLAQRVSR